MMKLSHPFIAELKRYVANQNAPLGPVIISLSELIKIEKSKLYMQEEIKAKQRKLAVVTDMIHAAHVFHRCVRDNITCDNANLTAKRQHQDNIMSLLLGDYLLAQSSVDMADLRYPKTVGLIARGLEDYTSGEFLKLQLFDRYEKQRSESDCPKIRDSIETYANLTCGSLLSNACLSAALLAGHLVDTNNNSKKISNLVFSFGFHTGSAHRLIELLYCPDTNSEADKAILESLDVKQFENSITNHIGKAVEVLLILPDGEKRASLLTMLSEMRNRCSPN